jgi:hypothetical protein
MYWKFLISYLKQSNFYIKALQEDIFGNLMNLYSCLFSLTGYPAIYQYPVSRRISGKSNPVSGRIPDIKKAGLSGRISSASLIPTLYGNYNSGVVVAQSI